MLKIACNMIAPAGYHESPKTCQRRLKARNKSKSGISIIKQFYLLSARNTKALKIITASLFVFSVLNAPYASITWVIISRFNNNNNLTSSELPTLEYIACIGLQITYITYPIFNGLINRDIRSKVIYMIKNATSLHFIDFGDIESEEIENNVCQIKFISRKETDINITISESQITEKSECKDIKFGTLETEVPHCSVVNDVNVITSDIVTVYRSVSKRSYKDEDLDNDVFEHPNYQTKLYYKTGARNQHFDNTDNDKKVDLPGMIEDAG